MTRERTGALRGKGRLEFAGSEVAVLYAFENFRNIDSCSDRDNPTDELWGPLLLRGTVKAVNGSLPTLLAAGQSCTLRFDGHTATLKVDALKKIGAEVIGEVT
jgi:hypothetical protein